MKKFMKKSNVAFIALALMMVASPAFANDAGDVAKNIFGQFESFASVITGGIFLAGLGIGGAAALKFKAHSENAQQVPLKVPMMYAIVAAICIGFVAFLQVGKATIFGADADGSGLKGSEYQQING